MIPAMNSPESFIESVGGLHDAILDRLTWIPGQRRLELAIQDLYSNFEDLPDDPGRCPAVLALVDVTSLRFDVSLTIKGLMMYEVTVARSERGLLNMTIAFSPSGKISLDCRDIECVEVLAPGASQP